MNHAYQHTVVGIAIVVWFCPLSYGQSGQQFEKHSLSDFSQYDSAQLQNLVVGEDLNVAIHAAWERMRRELKLRANKAQAAERYLGFLEGRLQVAVPPSWENGVRRAQLVGNHLIFRFSVKSPFTPSFIELPSPMTRGFQLTKSGTTWRLKGEGIDVPFVDFDPKTNHYRIGQDKKSCRYLAIAGDGTEGAVLGFSSGAPYTYPLIRMDKDGKTMWVTDVHCTRPTETVFIGFISTSTEIVTSGSRVFVFGISQQFGYIECFNLNDGSNLFRFSSYDWQGE